MMNEENNIIPCKHEYDLQRAQELDCDEDEDSADMLATAIEKAIQKSSIDLMVRDAANAEPQTEFDKENLDKTQENKPHKAGRAKKQRSGPKQKPGPKVKAKTLIKQMLDLISDQEATLLLEIVRTTINGLVEARNK